MKTEQRSHTYNKKLQIKVMFPKINVIISCLCCFTTDKESMICKQKTCDMISTCTYRAVNGCIHLRAYINYVERILRIPYLHPPFVLLTTKAFLKKIVHLHFSKEKKAKNKNDLALCT